MARGSRPYRAVPDDGVAWVTGASAGLGRALALRLAAEGFRVAVTARRGDKLDDLRTAGGGRIFPYAGDVTDLVRMRAAVAAIEDELGPIVVAVLNAGVYDLAGERHLNAELAWRTIEVNLGGVLRCLDPLLATMIGRQRGQIAIVASLAGYGGVPGSAVYGASKSALITLAEALRLTHARDGINVQVVNPGFIETAMTEANDYPMPFMISSETAARIISRGLQRGGFEIAFPRRLVWTMKAALVLPYRLWLPIMSRATRRTHR